MEIRSHHRLLFWAAALAATAPPGCETSGPVLIDTPNPPSPPSSPSSPSSPNPPNPIPPAPPALPALAPVPSPEQLAWQVQELTAFVHFGINTFTDKEGGDGTDSPTLFNPTALDANQWMTALRGAGFRQIMLTAKHADGFCLWPTKCTTYSVAASPWMGGQGDVVQMFVDAARAAGLGVGLALAPTDRHEPTFGTPAYLDVLRCQLGELLTNYGQIDELWLWSLASGAQPNLDWTELHGQAHALQPHTLVDIGGATSSVGADVRSVGQALATPMTDQSSVMPAPAATIVTPAATIWYPAEAVYRTRPGWFWHAAEDARLATLGQLLDIYYNSLGRNSVLRLNVTPDKQGLLPAADAAVVDQLGNAIRSIYQNNLATARPATADSVFMDHPTYAAGMAVDGKRETFWAAGAGTTTARLEIDLGGDRDFNVVSIQEPIALGERILQHRIETKVNGAWTVVATGTTVGLRRLHRLAAGTAAGAMPRASAVALVITAARGNPAVTDFGVFQSPFP